MVAEEIVGLSGNLPSYIMMTILFSYLIWSKFLKNGSLKPKNLNEVLDIITISIFTFVNLMGLIMLVSLIFGLFNLYNLGISKVWAVATTSISGILVIVLLVFIYNFRNKKYRDKKSSKSYFKKEFISSIFSYCCFISIFIGFYLLLSLSTLNYFFNENIDLMLIIITSMFFCFVVLLKALFEIKFKLSILSRKQIFICLVIILVISIFLGILIAPIVDYEDVVTSDYHIYVPSYNPPSEYWNIYLRINQPMTIRSFGVITPLIPLIPIDYAQNNIATVGLAAKFFKLSINTSEDIRSQTIVGGLESMRNYNPKMDKGYGFTSLVLDEEKKLILLKFDEKEVKKHNISQIILEGYVKKNMGELNYSYIDNHESPDLCYGDGCTLIIDATNGLDLPVYLEDDFFIFNFNNKNITDKSKCKFVNVTSNYPVRKDSSPDVGDRYMHADCDGDFCSFYICDVNEDPHLFRIDLGIKEGGVGVELRQLWFTKPLTINAKFDIVC